MTDNRPRCNSCGILLDYTSNHFPWCPTRPEHLASKHPTDGERQESPGEIDD